MARIPDLYEKIHLKRLSVPGHGVMALVTAPFGNKTLKLLGLEILSMWCLAVMSQCTLDKFSLLKATERRVCLVQPPFTILGL